MLPVLFASIAFGPPGPPLHKRLVDAVVRADITYRISHDRDYDTGPAAVSPSISSGTLTFVSGGRRFTYDLATLWPIREHRIILPASPAVGCGATDALSRHGRYLVIESVYAEKGCRANATFIDLSSGLVADEIGVDWTWDHRFDVQPAQFTGSAVTVDKVDIVSLQHVNAPWDFVVVHWSNGSAQTGLAAYEYLRSHIDNSPDPGHYILPRTGNTIRLGYLTYPNDPLAERHPVLRLGAQANRTYASLQPPDSSEVARHTRRNNWAEISIRRANSGDLAGAIAAQTMLLEFEDDPGLRTSEAADLDRCRAFIPIARQRKLSAQAIGQAWQTGCAPQKR